jgi:hypothetical protein
MYRVNSNKVIHETIEGETVLVNLDSGNYYSLDGVGAKVWGLINDGVDYDGMVKWVASRYDGNRAEIEESLRSLISELQCEYLIVTDETEEPETVEERGSIGTSDFTDKLQIFVPPALHKYTDMQDLLLLDPIHDVDETGWPSPKG